MTNKPNLLKNIKISIAKNNGISKYLHLWNLTKTNTVIWKCTPVMKQPLNMAHYTVSRVSTTFPSAL